MERPSPEQLQYLIEANLNGSAEPEDLEHLEEVLREFPDVRHAWLVAVSLQQDLELLSQQADPPAPTASTSRQHRLLSSRRAALSATSLAVVVCGLILLFRPASPPPTGSSASTTEHSATAKIQQQSPVILEAANARFFGEGLAPEPGQHLGFGQQYVLTQGYLGIRFLQGAKAVIKAPSVFQVQNAATLKIESGQCSIHAPLGAEGFRLLSPAAEVIDLGTRFVVDVAETGETELLVVEGAASIANSQIQDVNSHLLKTGESAHVEPGSAVQAPSPRTAPLQYHDSLPDRVVSYDATMTPDGFADELLSLVVQRDGRFQTYSRAQLIRSRLTHFTGSSGAATFCTRMGEALPSGDERLQLLDEDWSLVTGIINPRLLDSQSEAAASQPVMTVEFDTPIVNRPGPDIVLFDLQLLVYPPQGDMLRLRSGDVRRERKTWVAEQFDLDLTSPYALNLLPHRTYRSLRATTSLNDLISNDFRHGSQVHVNAKAIALGIDITLLGYREGEELHSLELLETFSHHNVDPVLIVGLPDMEEPAAGTDIGARN